MQVNGPDPGDAGEHAVHTIDIWFSPKRRHWVVQRLNERGEPVGHSHFCRTEAEARACLADWMRRHPETHLSAPRRQRSSAEGRTRA